MFGFVTQFVIDNMLQEDALKIYEQFVNGGQSQFVMDNNYIFCQIY